jgi:hypothetical protein
MSTYGFGDEPPAGQGTPAGLTLPPRKDSTPRPALAPLEAALDAGKAAGFVSREPSAARRKPGPRRTEPQAKLTLTGPKRVLDQLQAYCDAEGLPYWQAIEGLLSKAQR